MGVVSGKNASFSFAGDVYDGDDCLQDSGLDDAINEVVYQCSGYDKGVAGTRTAVFNVTLALSATDHAKINKLNPGDTGAFFYWPAGNTTTYFEIKALSSLITSASFSAPVNGVLAVDLSIRLNDITIQAASAT